MNVRGKRASSIVDGRKKSAAFDSRMKRLIGAVHFNESVETIQESLV